MKLRGLETPDSWQITSQKLLGVYRPWCAVGYEILFCTLYTNVLMDRLRLRRKSWDQNSNSDRINEYEAEDIMIMKSIRQNATMQSY